MAMHHGASAYAYQHGRHQNDKHAQHGIGDIQSGPDPAWREKSDYCQQCDDDTQSQSDPSGVAACHGHVFDGTHMREGLRAMAISAPRTICDIAANSFLGMVLPLEKQTSPIIATNAPKEKTCFFTQSVL